MIDKDIISNLIIILLTFIGFVIGFINEEYRLIAWTISFIVIITIIAFFILKSGFNTPQLAVADFKRQKIPIAKSKKICGKYPIACYRDSKFLGIFFIFNEYISKIENNAREIKKLKEDLNIQNRLIILETRINEHLNQ